MLRLVDSWVFWKVALLEGSVKKSAKSYLLKQEVSSTHLLRLLKVSSTAKSCNFYKTNQPKRIFLIVLSCQTKLKEFTTWLIWLQIYQCVHQYIQVHNYFSFYDSS